MKLLKENQNYGELVIAYTFLMKALTDLEFGNGDENSTISKQIQVIDKAILLIEKELDKTVPNFEVITSKLSASVSNYVNRYRG